MCGLIGYLPRTKNATRVDAIQYVGEQFEDQKHRGTEGFGIFEILQDGSFNVHRATEIVKMFIDLRFSEATAILMHHRNPTSTANKISQTHPIVVKHDELEYDYYVMHNGHISNSYSLKIDHEKLGYTYTTATADAKKPQYASTLPSFLDSESLAIELARYFENKSETVATEGGAAFIAIAVSKKTNKVVHVYIGKHDGRDLGYTEHDDFFTFSSEESYETTKTVDKQECIKFSLKTHAKDGHISFKATDTFTIKFKESPKALAGVVPPVSRTAGYHSSQPPAAAPAKSSSPQATKKNSTSSLVTGLDKLVEAIDATSIGNIFRGSNPIGQDVLVKSDIEKVKSLLAEGKVDEAEEASAELADSIRSLIADLEGTIEGAFDIKMVINNTMSLEEVVKEVEETHQARMRYIAGSISPLLRVLNYAESLLILAREVGKEQQPSLDVPTYAEIKAHNNVYKQTYLGRSTEGSGYHLGSSCKMDKYHTPEAEAVYRRGIHDEIWHGQHGYDKCKDISFHREEFNEKARQHYEVFGTSHSVEECNRPDFHSSKEVTPEISQVADDINRAAAIAAAELEAEQEDTAYAEREYAQTLDVSGRAEEEAASKLSALLDVYDQMHPDDFINEASEVADLVRTAASVAVEEYLLDMCELARDGGTDAQISARADRASRALETAEVRLVKLGRYIEKANDSIKADVGS